MKIILPKTYCYPIEKIDSPLFYFAGPVLGGNDWQHQGVREMLEYTDEFYAAIPCRYGNNHPLFAHRLEEQEGSFPHQTNWERYYLRGAGEKARSGCIVFWLPRESAINPRSDGNPYARDTYGEIGRWAMKPRVVVGAEAGFPGLDQIKHNLDADLSDIGKKIAFPIYDTLEKTIEAALRKVV